MPLLGAHCSTAGGLWTAFDRGEQIGCEAIQLFTKSNRRWAAPPLTEEETTRFRQRAAETGFPTVAHASYLINLASPDDAIWRKSLAGYQDEMNRCRALGIPYLVVHPGAHTGSGYDAGLARVAQALNEEHARGDDRVMVLLECTAGTGTTLGAEMSHFQTILEQVRQPERVGFCLDTCHAIGAGWDLTTPEGYAAVMQEFDERLGLARLRCFHLNDSHHDLGSRRDRHTHIGRGFCSLATFSHVLNDARFATTPMLLETPKNDDMAQDLVNLKVLRGLLNGCAVPVSAEMLDALWEGVDRAEGKDE